MEVEFKNKELVKLYETGKSRKYKLPKGILRKFFMRIEQIEAAVDIGDLWKTPSLHFKKLEGLEIYSIRLNDTWRLGIEIAWEDESQQKGKFYIIELSKHYGD